MASAVRWLAMLGWAMLAGLLVGVALAQDYGGSYTSDGPAGTISLTLRQDAEGSLTGTLTGSGINFELEGYVYPEDEVAAGAVYTAQGTAGFEAYLQDDTLGLYLFELDADGNPIAESATELIMTRLAGSPPDPGAAGNPLGRSSPEGNPLGQAAPAAPADPLVGTFSDGELSLALQGGRGRYSGRLEFGGQSYPVSAEGTGTDLAGSFTSQGQTFAFTAVLQGDVLAFETGGAAYSLRRQASVGAANPLAPPAPQTSGSVVARGQYADLSQDDALAFLEAFEFSLAQAGYAQTFTEAQQQQMLAAVVQSFPSLTRDEQLVLAQARSIWSEVRANWQVTPPEEQRAFVLAVFQLAYGEEAVQAMVGDGGAGGGGGSCSTFEDCAGAYADGDTYQDTQNAMSCWAAAGCDSYDAGSDTFYDTGGEPY